MTDERQQAENESSPSLWDDPVVEEVRAIRKRLWRESGCDIRRFIEQSRQADERRRNNTDRPAPPQR